MLLLPKVNICPKKIDWNGLPTRFMGENELETLCALIETVKPKTVVEFGINVGRTAKAILREVAGIEQYVGVDVLPGYVTEKAVQRKEVPARAGGLVEGDERVRLILKPTGSHELFESDLPECDVVFIDGDHSRKGVEKDTQLAHARVRKGGLIIWHDYHDLGTVDVRDVLHDFSAQGRNIKHVEGTWLAYEKIV